MRLRRGNGLARKSNIKRWAESSIDGELLGVSKVSDEFYSLFKDDVLEELLFCTHKPFEVTNYKVIMEESKGIFIDKLTGQVVLKVMDESIEEAKDKAVEEPKSLFIHTSK